MFLLLLFVENATKFLGTSLLEHGIGVDGAEGNEIISAKEAEFDGPAMSLVEAVDGEGEGVSCDFLLANGG